MITVWTAYLLAAAAASGIFIVAGWRTKRVQGPAALQGLEAIPVDHLWGDTEIDVNDSESQADVGAAIRLALKRLAPVMASRSVHVDFASPSGLMVRMRGAALADLLEEILAAAIHSAPASRILMTAMTRGDRINVGITDDMPGADLAVRQGRIRSLMERVAMRGGALDVSVRPSEGTTMTLRLAAATEKDEVASAPASIRPGFTVPAER